MTGPLTIDVTQPPYCCQADDGATDNTAGLQAAVDAAGTRASVTGRTVLVYLPGALGTYMVQDRIWVDRPRVELVGDGPGASVLRMGYPQKDVLMFGCRRSEPGASIGAEHRPDACGILDSAACPEPGRRWGLRTRRDSWAQFQASPLANGPISPRFGRHCADNWAETSQLTLECMIEPGEPGEPFTITRTICGVGAMYTTPVFCLWTDGDYPGGFVVSFKTADMDPSAECGLRLLRFSPAGFMPPYRLTVQWDLTTATVAVFVGDTTRPARQVAPVATSNLTPDAPIPFRPTTGFASNDYYPFMIGADGVRGPESESGGIDLVLYGLRLSRTLRYRVDGPGTPQVRADDPAAPIDDTFRYFTDDASTIAYLPLTDDPASLTRNVAVQHGHAAGGQVGGGLFMSVHHGDSLSRNAVRHLSVIGPGGPYTTPIAVAAVLDFDLEDIEVDGGFYGVGSWHYFASWTIRGSRLNLKASDAPYYGWHQIVHLDELQFPSTGRTALRLVGCDDHVTRTSVMGWGRNTECVVKLQAGGYSGVHTIRKLLVDFEGQAVPLAMIYCENAPYCGATLLLEDINVGSIGPDAPLLMLRDMGRPGTGTWKPAFLHALNITAYVDLSDPRSMKSLVEVDGPLWYGTVEGAPSSPVIPTLTHRGTWGANTGILVKGAP